ISRTSLGGFVGGVGYADSFFCLRESAALNQATPHDTARLGAILVCFVVAIAFALVAVVCGRLTYKCMRAASRSRWESFLTWSGKVQTLSASEDRAKIADDWRMVERPCVRVFSANVACGITNANHAMMLDRGSRRNSRVR